VFTSIGTYSLPLCHGHQVLAAVMSYYESLNHLIFSEKDLANYNGHHRLETFQITQRPAHSAADRFEGRNDVSTWSSTNCVQWLQESLVATTASEPTLKILMVCTRNQLTAQPSNPEGATDANPKIRPATPERVQQAKFIKDIFLKAQFPLSGFASYIKTLITFACMPTGATPGQADHHTVTHYYCSAPSWAVTWAYACSSKATSAILLYREGDGEERVREVIDDLLRLQTDIEHPMLLAYVKTKISLSRAFSSLLEMNFETLSLEQETGLSTWDWALERKIKGKGSREDYDRTVDGFSALSGKVTNIKFRLRTVQEQIKFVMRCNKNHREFLQTQSDEAAMQRCTELDNMLQVIAEYTTIHLFDAESLSERLTNQMTSIFQLTAQKDSRTNLAIAEDGRTLAVESQRDNSSMKTIAVVSLVFLPPTFVASAFAMPLFDWNAATIETILSQRFWMFWAVSAPLTVIICMIWGLWYQRKQKHLKERNLAAQEKLKKQIARKYTSSVRERGRSVSRHAFFQRVRQSFPLGAKLLPTIGGSDVESARTNSGVTYKSWRT
jgi:Mg2+ and Co2+ transporter CorA